MVLRRSALCLSCLQSLWPLIPDLLTLSLGLWDAQRHLRSSCPQGAGKSLWFLGLRLNQIWTTSLSWACPVPSCRLSCWSGFPAPLGRGSPQRKGKLGRFLQDHLKLLNTHQMVQQTLLAEYRASR